MRCIRRANPYSHYSKQYPEISPQEIKRIAQDHRFRPSVPDRNYRKPSLKEHEQALKPSFSAPEKLQFSSPIKPSTDRHLVVGGALILGGIIASAYFEHKKNPGVEMMTIAKRNLLTTLKYGALPSALLYVWMQNPQQVS